MRIARVMAGGETFYAIVTPEGAERLSEPPFGGIRRAEGPAVADYRLLAPVTPGKIVCVGLNYSEHVREVSADLPAGPVLFMKPPSAVVGPGEPIVWPEDSDKVDYEAELAVVIGKRARHISAAEAPDIVLGYTCANDVSARDIQKADGQWTRAKGFDTFAPLGPWIKTRLDPASLSLQTIIDGKTVQRGNTRDMICGVFELLAFISRAMTLEPGDVVLTGTPSGIGPLVRGRDVTIEIEGIGALTNPVI